MKMSRVFRGKPGSTAFAKRMGILNDVRARYPLEFAELVSLLKNAKPDSKIELHKFAYEVDSIVWISQKRENTSYTQRHRARCKTLDDALDLLDGLEDDIATFDLKDIRAFHQCFLDGVHPAVPISWDMVIAVIASAKSTLKDVRDVYEIMYGPPSRGRGRKPLEQHAAAKETMDLWKRWSGKKVPISKTHQGEIQTVPAQFVKTLLAVIYKDITDANIVTLINEVHRREDEFSIRLRRRKNASLWHHLTFGS